MPIITLTTDFGTKDYFVAAIKGAIYNALPLVKIVDISHKIAPFNIPETAYIINNAYPFFSDGTIHIIGVDAEWNPENKHIVIKLKNQYFIGADNGILSLLINNTVPCEQYEILIPEQEKSIFPVLNIFVKVAVHIANGGALSLIGKPIHQLHKLGKTTAQINEAGNQIIGNVIYIDHYGNVVFNISKSLFNSVRNGRNYKISVGTHKYPIDAIYDNYSDVVNFKIPAHQRIMNEEGKALAIFNSAGFFQVSIYKSNSKTVGGASSLLGLKYGNTIIINFL